MALKDWKRVKGKLNWESAKKDQDLFIEKLNLYEILDEKYVVKIENEFGDILKEDYFKTKSQALKFAKQYMRTH